MITLPSGIAEFMDRFRDSGFEIYIVGGAVRHLIQNQHVNNWDFATNALPEQIQRLFPHNFYHNVFGTVSVPSPKEGILEVTPFRKESGYEDKRHPTQIAWAQTLQEDLARRDFTINAMAYDGKSITDPYNGQKHLKEGIICAVGNPEVRFKEDALRLLRAVRLVAQLGFLIEEKTREAIKKNAGLIVHISWERIRDEFLKILESNHPAEGVLFLRNTTLLSYILPELDVCFSIPQKSPQRHHIYDVGTHLVQALKHCPSPNGITRFATLLHDIGKAQTYRKDNTSGLITFYNHEVVGTMLVKKIADRFRLSNEQKDKLITLVQHHQFTVTEEQTDKAVRRFIRDVGKEYVQDMFDLRTGDRIGSGATPSSWRLELFKKRVVEVQKTPFSVEDLQIDGNIIMKTLQIKPGKRVGEILQLLFEKVVNGEIKNEQEVLLKELNTLHK